MTAIIEERTNRANKAASASQRTPSASVPSVDLSDARRSSGQPVIQWFRLQRSMEELLHFRASGRHHTASEVSEPRSHARWKKESVALLRALADAIVEGQLEPAKPKATPEADVDDVEW